MPRLPVLLVLLTLAGALPAAAQERAERAACSATPCPLQVAVTSHPLVAAARASVDSFEAKLQAVKLAWLPTLSSRGLLSATPRKWGTPLVGGTTYEFEEWRPLARFELSGTMPVYGFGKISLLREMAEMGLDVGDAQVHVARSQIELLVVQAYFSVQFSEELADLLGEGEKYLARARKYLEKLRDEDSEEYDDVDMLRLKVYESTVAGYRLDAVRLGELALSGLVKLTGQPEAAFQPPEKLAALEASLEDEAHYLAVARKERGELRALRGVRQIQALRVSFEKRRFLPDFFLGAYFTWARAWAVEQQPSPFAYDPYNSWFAGAGLGLEFKLDLPRQLLALDEARAEERKLTAQQQALVQKVEMDVEQAFKEARDL